jgi:spore coat polysaccharide biosynthesis protein SpsF
MIIVATIECRLNSKRLPNKLLLPLGNSTVIEFLIERLKKSKLIDKIIIATTKKNIDKKLFKISRKHHVEFFGGSENNVLKRVYDAAKKFNADAIVQVSGDSPLTDPKIIDEWVKIYKKEKPDILSEGWNNLPSGITAPIIKTESLKTCLNQTKKKSDLEHVTKFIFSNPNIFNILFYKSKKNQRYPNLHLCVDEIYDYNLVNLIVKNNLNKELNCVNIIRFCKKNKNILNINRKVFRKSKKYHKKYLKVNHL